MKKKPLVSVSMITYRHEDYIEQAINSVLMQQADFDIELVISNDNSPDKTDAIIQGILKNHSKAAWIKYIKHEKNLGMMANLIDNLRQCTGDYIAFCEGDDYWINPLKLQIQVDYLTAHSDCVACYHSRIQVDGNGNLIQSYPDPAHDYSSEELLSGTSIPMTNTLLFRNIITNDFSKFEVFGGDVLILHLLGFYGYCKYISSIHNGTAYRIHDGGVWSRLSRYERVKAWLMTRKVIRKNIIANCSDEKILDLHDKGYLIFFNTILSGLILDKNIKKYFVLINDIRVDKELCRKDIFLYHIDFVAKAGFKKIIRNLKKISITG